GAIRTVTTVSSASAAGPTGAVGGIPVEFAHTEQGAVAASASYVRTIAAAVSGGYGARALEVLAVPPLSELAASNARGLAAAGRLLSGSSGVAFVRVWPLGYRV